MRHLVAIEIHTLVHGALNRDTIGARQGQVLANPPRNILVGGLIDNLIQVHVVQRFEDFLHAPTQRRDLAPWKRYPIVSKVRKYRCLKTMAVNAATAVAIGEQVHVTSGLEAACRDGQGEGSHAFPLFVMNAA
jgi:hypothetical protein